MLESRLSFEYLVYDSIEPSSLNGTARESPDAHPLTPEYQVLTTLLSVDSVTASLCSCVAQFLPQGSF